MVHRKLLAIVPAWNEEESIAITLDALTRSDVDYDVDYDVVVVDDGSTDRTVEIAHSAGVKVLPLPFNLGVGGAMRTGFLYAYRAGYDAVVQVDADGQHAPRDIGRLVEQLTYFDIVIGSRFKDHSKYDVRGPRAWAMKLLAFSLSRVAKTRLTDVTSGFRAANRAAMRQYIEFYPVEYLGDTVESLVAAVRSGLLVSEVGVTMNIREHGEPSHNALKSTVQLVRSVFALCVALTRRATTREV